IVLIFAVIFACVAGISVSTALGTSDTPQEVTITQLVNGEIKTSQHVSVSGLAVYEANYYKTEDGKTTETYYFLLDRDSGDMVLIKHSAATVIGKQTKDATIIGMTRTPSSDLKTEMNKDIDSFGEDGLRTTTDILVAEGQKPPDLTTSIILLAAALGITGISLIPFFFPSTVFMPQSLDTTATLPATRAALKATGTFQRLKGINPLELGKGTQRFNRAVANFIPRAERDVMIYIHQIVTTKRYGITISRRETDWGAFLNGENVQAVEAGKILSWKDQWAVHFAYTNAKGKDDHLYLIFEDAGGQVDVANQLQQLKFQVNTAEMLA
ncbi:MAG TPA: hypothetical protein PKH77_27215, partial [Anaerolineae bacterium]|nr:hypothetical protein [Anaerolineae bacterium]